MKWIIEGGGRDEKGNGENERNNKAEQKGRWREEGDNEEGRRGWRVIK